MLDLLPIRISYLFRKLFFYSSILYLINESECEKLPNLNKLMYIYLLNLVHIYKLHHLNKLISFRTIFEIEKNSDTSKGTLSHFLAN